VRILVAPDTFKGSLSAVEAAQAMGRGAAQHDPSAEIDIAPMSDGGRGFAGRMLAAIGGEVGSIFVEDPTGRMVEAEVAWLSDRSVAFDAASACGLRGVPTPDDSLRASTFGVGQLLLHVARSERPVTSVIVGVGDTATTDGGTGAARAAGWRFLDRSGSELAMGGGALRRLASIVRPSDPIDPALQVIVGCDVSATLHGSEGAAQRYSPQKGAGEREVEWLDEGLRRLDAVIRSGLGSVVGRLAGGGAGGGLGAGLAAFFDATLRSGFDIVADAVRLDERIAQADVVLTGEGKLDASSFAGKVTGEISRRARSSGTPCVVVAGRIDVPADWLAARQVSAVSLDVRSVTPAAAAEEATRRALANRLD
jgi:glycerate kinase